MPHTYDADFYADQRNGSIRSAQKIVPSAVSLIQPKSVLDVGCGLGTWLRAFIDNGVQDVLGLDGDYVQRDKLLIDPSQFVPCNISKPPALNRRFDLATCLEVAEHIPASEAASLVAYLVSAAPVVLFSAAIPGQGGEHHVNEQWQDYWKALFAVHGFKPYDIFRPQFWGQSDVEWWYQQNMILYCTADVATSLKIQDCSSERSLNLVHPYLYSKWSKIENYGLFAVVGALPKLVIGAVQSRMK